MRILLVLSHPRENSLTAAVAKRFEAGALSAGHEVEWADLYREKFDPVLEEPDEPDRNIIGKRYSDAVHQEMQRIERNAAIVMVFPVWWWSMPAMLKGWIDRVWNRDWAYGAKKFPLKSGLMIGVASSGAPAFAKRGYDSAMITQLRVGVMEYCGIEHARLELLYDSTESDKNRTALLERAKHLGETY